VLRQLALEYWQAFLAQQVFWLSLSSFALVLHKVLPIPLCTLIPELIVCPLGIAAAVVLPAPRHRGSQQSQLAPLLVALLWLLWKQPSLALVSLQTSLLVSRRVQQLALQRLSWRT